MAPTNSGVSGNMLCTTLKTILRRRKEGRKRGREGGREEREGGKRGREEEREGGREDRGKGCSHRLLLMYLYAVYHS